MVGAWLGNGPIHSTRMLSFAKVFANSPRSFAINGNPPKPQVNRTVSVSRAAARAFGAKAPAGPRASNNRRRSENDMADSTGKGSGIRANPKVGQQTVAQRNG